MKPFEEFEECFAHFNQALADGLVDAVKIGRERAQLGDEIMDWAVVLHRNRQKLIVDPPRFFQVFSDPDFGEAMNAAIAWIDEYRALVDGGAPNCALEAFVRDWPQRVDDDVVKCDNAAEALKGIEEHHPGVFDRLRQRLGTDPDTLAAAETRPCGTSIEEEED